MTPRQYLQFHRPDLRGVGFVLCGFIWCLMGFGVSQGFSGTELAAPHTQIPLFWREALWMVPGILAWVAAWNRSLHGPTLVLLIAAPLVRVVSYFWAWVIYMLPAGGAGYERGWYVSVVHLAFIILVIFVASVPPGRRDTWGTSTQTPPSSEE